MSLSLEVVNQKVDQVIASNTSIEKKLDRIIETHPEKLAVLNTKFEQLNAIATTNQKDIRSFTTKIGTEVEKVALKVDSEVEKVALKVEELKTQSTKRLWTIITPVIIGLVYSALKGLS